MTTNKIIERIDLLLTEYIKQVESKIKKDDLIEVKRILNK